MSSISSISPTASPAPPAASASSALAASSESVVHAVPSALSAPAEPAALVAPVAPGESSAPLAAPAPGLAGRMVRLAWRAGLGFCAGVAVLAALGTAAFLGGCYALLRTMERDVTLGIGNVSFWREWMPSFDLLAQYAWAYLAGAVGVLFVALPLVLAVLERMWYWGVPRGKE